MSAIPAYPKDEIASADLADKHDLEDKLPAGEVDDVQAVDSDEHDPFEVDQHYLVASRSTKFFRGVLFQMVLFGA